MKRLLRLKNFEESQKLDWVEAFLEAYGVRRELNPYINSSDLAPYLKKLSDRIKSFHVESTSLIENQKKREQEINQRIYDLKSRTEKFRHLFKKEEKAHSALLRRFKKFKSLHMKRLSLRDIKRLKKDMQRHLKRYMNGNSERSAQLTEAITQIDTVIEVKEMMNKNQQAEFIKNKLQRHQLRISYGDFNFSKDFFSFDDESGRSKLPKMTSSANTVVRKSGLSQGSAVTTRSSCASLSFLR